MTAPAKKSQRHLTHATTQRGVDMPAHVPQATREQRRAYARDLAKHAATWPKQLTRLEPKDWPELAADHPAPPDEVWRSRAYLVQIRYLDPSAHGGAAEHLSIRRTIHGAPLTWDEIQVIKRDVGRGDRAAVEVYPEDAHLIDQAEMRHLWILTERPAFAWRRAQPLPPIEIPPEAQKATPQVFGYDDPTSYGYTWGSTLG